MNDVHTSSMEVPTRRLGRTGESVSMVGLGGFHLGKCSRREAIRIVQAAVERGVTFLDNSWDYHEGTSEERVGDALAEGYRDRAFVMTKIDGRTRKEAARQIEQSLKRLRTDRVDLIQLHEVIRFEDADRAFGPDGAIEALAAARDAGKLRYVGFTGHKDPSVHRYMLDVAHAHGFRFDAVQLPLNVLDAHFRSFEHRVLPSLIAEDIGVIGMKPICAGQVLRTGTLSATECLHYVMNLPVSTVVTGVERMELLDQAVQAALSFRPLDEAVVRGWLERTATAARDGRYESYKTTAEHDSTAKYQEWLG